jgi:hypothetical protein
MHNTVTFVEVLTLEGVGRGAEDRLDRFRVTEHHGRAQSAQLKSEDVPELARTRAELCHPPNWPYSDVDVALVEK